MHLPRLSLPTSRGAEWPRARSPIDPGLGATDRDGQLQTNRGPGSDNREDNRDSALSSITVTVH